MRRAGLVMPRIVPALAVFVAVGLVVVRPLSPLPTCPGYQRPSRPRLTPCTRTPPLALIVPTAG
jgi:hypothetical protein